MSTTNICLDDFFFKIFDFEICFWTFSRFSIFRFFDIFQILRFFSNKMYIFRLFRWKKCNTKTPFTHSRNHGKHIHNYKKYGCNMWLQDLIWLHCRTSVFIMFECIHKESQSPITITSEFIINDTSAQLINNYTFFVFLFLFCLSDVYPWCMYML